jgi:hypothetical protein
MILISPILLIMRNDIRRDCIAVLATFDAYAILLLFHAYALWLHLDARYDFALLIA